MLSYGSVGGVRCIVLRSVYVESASLCVMRSTVRWSELSHLDSSVGADCSSA